MTVPDPLKIKFQASKLRVLSAFVSEKGERETQEDGFGFLPEECFVVSQGRMPSREMASKLAVESVLWSIQLARRKPSYWKEIPSLLIKTVKTAHLQVYKKGLGKMSATLTILLFSTTKYFIASVGDSGVLLFRKGKLIQLTESRSDELGDRTSVIGAEKKIPPLVVVSGVYKPRDVFFVVNDGVLDWIHEIDVQLLFMEKITDVADIHIRLAKLCRTAKERGSTGNLTVGGILVK